MRILSFIVVIFLLGSGSKPLLEKKADPNKEVSKGRSVLMEASYKGKLKEVKELIKNGANINFVGEQGQSALLQATNGGHLEVVKLLVKSGAKVNHRANSGTSALKNAVLSENVQMVKFLVASGADTKAPGLGKKNIEELAKELNNKEILTLILPNNKDK